MIEERPTTIHAEEALTPRAPWSFLRAALPGGFTRWGWGLIAGWVLVLLGPTLGWAGHLRHAVRWSALPSHWGEGISARDIWELWENGGLRHRAASSPTVHLLGLGIVIVLWCGWRMQAETAGGKATLRAWLLGALDTLLVGLLPLGLVAWGGIAALRWLGEMGIDGLGWSALIGVPLFAMGAAAALNLQWWFCRLGRAAGLSRGYRAHLKDSFLRLWTHPIQWGAVCVGGAAVRSLLPFLVLLLAWRLGGGTTLRVTALLGLQLLATVLNAWLMGWLLRASALFWVHDAAVRTARATLKEESRDVQIL